MTAQPWMKWYPADWRADPNLRVCSPIARYVWMEMLGLMHEAEPYGHLLLNGRPIQNEMLSRLIGVEVRVVAAAVKELDRQGVFSRTNAGVIISRRMLRDREKAEEAKKHGGKGGNPALKKQVVSATEVNLCDNGQDKAQKPEARIPETRMQSIPPQPVAGRGNGMGKGEGRIRLGLFPSDGSIEFTPWADVVRAKKRNIDVNATASAFRKFCHEKDIPLNRADIEQVFGRFCEKHRVQ